MKTVPLKRVVGINLQTLPETTEPGFEFRYVDIGAVSRGQLNSEPEASVFASAPSRARRLVRQGDTIISTVRTYLRAVWPVRDSATDLVVSTGFAVLTPTRSIDSRYLGWLVQADVVVEEVVARSAGVSYPAINPSDIGTVRVPLPPLARQRAIADYLDRETARIDALIERRRQTIDVVEERFDSIVWDEITGTRFVERKPCSLSWLEDVPAHWDTPTVSVNFDLQLGQMLNAAAASAPEQSPYLRNVNVQWDRFDLEDIHTMYFDGQSKRRRELRPRDLLVCEGGEVGRAAVWSGELKDCYYQKAIHRLRPRQGANSHYLMYCLRAAAKRSVFAVEGNVSTIAHLTGEQLRVHRFPWPPDYEQVEIVARLDKSATLTARAAELLGRQIKLLEERRQALITAAVTGELDAPEAAA